MTDTKLRELERRWRETGSVEDEAAYLLERVRVGSLLTEHLELAAFVGHAGAAAALNLPVLAVPRDCIELARGLLNWGAEPLVGAVAAFAQNGLFQTASPVSQSELLEAALAALAWSRCPCALHADLAACASEKAAAAAIQLVHEELFEAAAWARLAREASWLAANLSSTEPPSPAALARAAKALEACDIEFVKHTACDWALTARCVH